MRMSLTQIGESAENGDGPTYVLGVSEAHNCTAALLRDGEIIAAASEERFTRFKNDTGYPKKRSTLFSRKQESAPTRSTWLFSLITIHTRILGLGLIL